MTVDNMGIESITVEITQKIISEVIEMVPKLFFRDIDLIGTVDTNNINFIVEWLDMPGIIGTDRLIIESSGHQVDPGNIRVFT